MTSRSNRSHVEAALDAMAAAPVERGVDPPTTRRLRAYAHAIFAGSHPPTETTSPELALRVPQSLAAAWSLAAAAENQGLDEWIVATLEYAEFARSRWEAAAAYAARSLEGWAALGALEAI